MEASYCLECKKETEVILDRRTGDTICSGCGLVLESYGIDETPEWRTFTDNSNDGDPNRVGSPINPILDTGNLFTFFSKPDGETRDFPWARLSQHQQASNEGKSLAKGFKIITEMAERLGLASTIKDRACEIFKEIDDVNKKHFIGRKEALPAACIRIASKDLKLSRTLKEIATVAGGVSMKKISKAVKIVEEHVEVQRGPVLAEELTKRFCYRLNLDYKAIKAVQEAVEKSAEIDVRRTPKATLGAIIYMITRFSNTNTSLRDISAAAEVTEGTIKKSYKDLSPYASRLVPDWCASEEAVRRKIVPMAETKLE